MDLVLLQPGDSTLFNKQLGGPNSWKKGGTLINPSLSSDKAWGKSMSGFKMFKPDECIELVSVHQGMKQQMTTDVSNSARTSGRPVITEFTCVKYVDRTSAKFYDYCLRALPIGAGADKPTMIYVCRNSGTEMANIMTFQLRNAMISEIQFQTHPNDMPTEQFKLNFVEVIWTYNVQLSDTESGGKVSAGWSLARNGPIGGEFTK